MTRPSSSVITPADPSVVLYRGDGPITGQSENMTLYPCGLDPPETTFSATVNDAFAHNVSSYDADLKKGYYVWRRLVRHLRSGFYVAFVQFFGSGFDVDLLPPAYVRIAGMNLIRDDGVVDSYVLDDAKVQVKLNVYRGVPHSFYAFVLAPKQSRSAMDDIAKRLGWLFNLEVDKEKAVDAMLLNY